MDRRVGDGPRRNAAGGARASSVRDCRARLQEAVVRGRGRASRVCPPGEIRNPAGTWTIRPPSVMASVVPRGARLKPVGPRFKPGRTSFLKPDSASSNGCRGMSLVRGSVARTAVVSMMPSVEPNSGRSERPLLGFRWSSFARVRGPGVSPGLGRCARIFLTPPRFRASSALRRLTASAPTQVTGSLSAASP
jgi:hypothetical protein